MKTKQEIVDFLKKLNSIFPIEGKRVEAVFDTYTDILLERCLKKEYDAKKLLSRIAQEHKYSYFPTVKLILEQLPYAEIVHYWDAPPNEGALIVLTLTNGVIYAFTVTDFGKTVQELKADYRKKYGECEIKMYPKGSVLIGNTVIEP